MRRSLLVAVLVDTPIVVKDAPALRATSELVPAFDRIAMRAVAAIGVTRSRVPELIHVRVSLAASRCRVRPNPLRVRAPAQPSRAFTALPVRPRSPVVRARLALPLHLYRFPHRRLARPHLERVIPLLIQHRERGAFWCIGCVRSEVGNSYRVCLHCRHQFFSSNCAATSRATASRTACAGRLPSKTIVANFSMMARRRGILIHALISGDLSVSIAHVTRNGALGFASLTAARAHASSIPRMYRLCALFSLLMLASPFGPSSGTA